MPGASVAIVGIGCRLFGARTVEELWARLSAPPRDDDGFVPLPPDRWDAAAFGPPPRAQLLADYDVDFRPFRIPPAQLARMHRMERAMLAALYDALVDAELAKPGAWGARTSVHMGATTLGFDPLIDHTARVRLYEMETALDAALADLTPEVRAAAKRALEELAPPISVDSLMTTAAMTAGRLANAFDLGGGHFAHDAGGASGVAALAAAVASLEARDCDLAVVGAPSPLCTATIAQAYARRRLLAAGDRLGELGESPSGTLLAEGAVALVLARADDARQQARRVYAVVRGVGTASAGRRGVAGLSPTIAAAAKTALDAARFAPRTIDYVEVQAAGIPTLDETELAAVADVYRGGEARVSPLPLASVAPAVGYLGAAGGLAATAAAALSLWRGERPSRGARSFTTGTAGNVAARSTADVPVRRAAVSAVALGGVAYHVVLAREDDRRPRASSTPIAGPDERRVAIVGVGCVMPGAPNAGELWRAIVDGKDALGHIPPSRWPAEALLAAATRDVPGAVRSTLAGLLPPLRRDATLLHVPPVSLRHIDGAVVLTVEACVQALEDAGYRAGRWDPRRVGVIVGHLPLRAAEFDAERTVLAARAAARVGRVLESAGVDAKKRAAASAQLVAALTAGVPPIAEETLDSLSSLPLAARVATLFDFRGGAEAVDAACASSLVAVHLAAGALARGELDAVVVAASAYNLIPEYYVALGTLGALGVSGSRPFDLGGDGMVPGEGAGAVILRRVADAARDGERIYAVVRAGGTSSDGRGSALLAPSTRGQQRALRRAYAAAQIDPTSIDFIEGHGTGTRAGDAVELETYGAIFGARDKSRPITLGSVKSNIGHLSSAAGMAGLIKTALALSHATLPPMRHTGRLHPDHAALAGGPLRVTTQATPWPPPGDGTPRRAGVSAFGLGGINAHVVLEEHVAAERRARPPSAPTMIPVERRAQRLRIDLVPLGRSSPTSTPLVSGARVLVVGGDSAVRRALCDKLSLAGARPLALAPDANADVASIEAAVRALDRPGQPVAGVVDVTALAATNAPAADAALAAVHRALGISRAAYGAWERGDVGCFYVVATAMGGSLGFLPGGQVAEGGALTGFVKGLKQELPNLLARAVDFDPKEDADWIAETLLAELLVGGDRAEVGYFTRRRVVPVLRNAPLNRAAPPLATLEPGMVVLFSGGGRGVVLECARALGKMGLVAVITGRTPPPDANDPSLALDDAAFEALRRREMAAARKRDPTLTPVRFDRSWQARANARQLARNLDAARAAGEPVEYLPADVTDAADCARLVAEVRRRHGRVDGVVHGAMIEQSRSLPDKSPAVVAATVRTKVAGLCNLIVATAAEPLRFIVAFGSVAGRLGNRGQADYCAANDAMAKLLAQHAAEHPTVRCVTIDWTAWAKVGAAAEPRTAQLLAAAGIEALSPEEGTSWLVDELRHGAPAQHEVLVCSEAQVNRWPFAARVAEASGAAPVAVDDRGQPLWPADWPLVDGLLRESSAEWVADRVFDGAREPFLREHRLDDVPVLPGAFALELLAEVAALGGDGLELRAISDFVIEAPLRLPPPSAQRLRSRARSRAEGNGRRVEVQSSADAALAAPLRRDRLHYRASVLLGPAARRRDDDTRPQVLTEAPRQPSLFDTLRTPIALGRAYRNIAWVERHAHAVRAELRPPEEHGLFPRTAAPRLITDPLLVDAAFQVASHWDGLGPERRISIPVGVRLFEFFARRPPDAGALVEARVTEQQGRDVFFDVVVQSGKALLFTLRGLQLRRLE
jgi:enediyne polyketide synthase